MSKLLLDEKPLLVLPSLAKKIGLNEAIVIQQLHYWIEISGHDIEGENWVYATHEELQSQFPWWSTKTIQRTLTNLKDNGLIKVNNFNKKKYDKTNWYTIDYKKLNELEEDENTVDVQMDRSDCPVDEDKLTSSRSGQNDQTNTRYKTTTENIYATGHKEKDPLKKEEYTPEFESFWKECPRKVEKTKAYKCWRTRLKEGHTAGEMIMAAQNYAKAKKGEELRFIKHPSTFIGPDKPFLEYISSKPVEEGVEYGQEVEDTEDEQRRRRETEEYLRYAMGEPND